MTRPTINERAFLDHRLRAIEEYLRAHISDPKRLSLTHAARVANVSPEHLSRMFHERVGAPFTDWQCAVRTEAAKRFIVNGLLQLHVVGRAVGYERYETFCRVFKRYEGVPPRHLRWFVTEYPELAPAVCSFTALLVFRIGPLLSRTGDLHLSLLDIATRLAADRLGTAAARTYQNPSTQS
jgi:AraC-like DNA-binding protein